MRITAIEYREENGKTILWLCGEGIEITVKTDRKQDADRIKEVLEKFINGEKENICA